MFLLKDYHNTINKQSLVCKTIACIAVANVINKGMCISTSIMRFWLWKYSNSYVGSNNVVLSVLSYCYWRRMLTIQRQITAALIGASCPRRRGMRWYKLASKVFIYCIIHICCGLIYSLNGLICAPERLNHPLKSFTLFITRQHMIRDICQSMALFCSHRRLLSLFWSVRSTLYSSCHAACQCCKIR